MRTRAQDTVTRATLDNEEALRAVGAFRAAAAVGAVPSFAPGGRLAVATAVAAAAPFLAVVFHVAAPPCTPKLQAPHSPAPLVLPLYEPAEPRALRARAVVHNALRHCGARLDRGGKGAASCGGGGRHHAGFTRLRRVRRPGRRAHCVLSCGGGCAGARGGIGQRRAPCSVRWGAGWGGSLSRDAFAVA